MKGNGVNKFPAHAIDRLRCVGPDRIDDQTAKKPRLNTHGVDTGLAMDVPCSEGPGC